MILRILRRITPKPILQFYHYALARVSALAYGFPSEKLIVIGVTGTNGKSSTVQFIAQLLMLLGHRVGYATTAGFFIAGETVENRLKMTMPGRFLLQKLIRQMVNAKCEYAIIETSSQGIAQFRHLGINYDEAVFTNLTPEHLEAHGGFENYKQAKGKLFAHLAASPRKTIADKMIPKVSVINADDEHAEFFASFTADKTIRFSWSGNGQITREHVPGIPFEAEYQQKNVVAAVAALVGLGFPLDEIVKVVPKLKPIVGRFEIVDKGQPFKVIIDYAYEPHALTALFRSIGIFNPKRVIGVHGSAGGGRDKARRPLIGQLAAKHEAIVIVTNEDPYDEDPRDIMEAVADGARSSGKRDGIDLFLIADRSQAIDRAIALSKPGDVVILTGKGSEPVIAVADGKKIPWNERAAAEAALANLGFV